MERKQVYAAIDSERDYQDKMSADPTRPDMNENMSTGDIISAIQHNLNKACNYWYSTSNPHEEAMNYIRKIAALCVKAGEKNGMPSR